ncbi:MAG: polymer-forming cytoskeletal protein [Chloroflexi bacterium]|nr:polymer-forming cytoskeletal protein [Chloroflexota bacterium]
MSKTHKVTSIFIMLVLLTLTIATPARAFDGRSGDKVTLNSGDIVNDDLYVGANEFVLDGTVNGDVFAGAQMITINGTINGDLLAMGQTVIINGTVTGSVRMAGSVLFFGEKAKVGGDIVGGGASLEVRKGSVTERDLVFGGGQILLAGDVMRNVTVGTGSLQISGNIGGNVKAGVGDANQGQAGPPPSMFLPRSTVGVPLVRPGLTIDPSAKIAGNLEYTQARDLTFPAGVIAGKITRTEPPANPQPAMQETAGYKVGAWTLELIRSMVTLVLIGLFLLWLFPAFFKSLSEKLKSKTWPSLGWGVIAYAAFFFALLLILFVMIVGAILFGILTLGGLSGTIIWLGILALFAFVVAFALVTSFVAKVVFGMTIGKWILVSANSPLAENRFWSMAIGVFVTTFVIALLSFPLIPTGFLGGLLNFAVTLFGLGAMWLWGREALGKKPVAA